MDKKGRIMEGPRGGQFTAPRSVRPEEEQLNTKINRKGRKAQKQFKKAMKKSEKKPWTTKYTKEEWARK
jgi:hypothetical protein